MSKVSEEDKKKLEKPKQDNDSEYYHIVFDGLLEKKLMELDPEWMTEMNELYDDSGRSRWCA